VTIEVGWLDQHQTIMHYRFDGAWGWNDFYPAYNRAVAMEKAAGHRVDVILDVRDGGRMPADLLPHIKQITDQRPANLGLVVVVTQSATARTLFTVASRFDPRFKRYYSLVETPEQARRIIAESRLKMDSEYV
jgi:hypothetical protein